MGGPLPAYRDAGAGPLRRRHRAVCCGPPESRGALLVLPVVPAAAVLPRASAALGCCPGRGRHHPRPHGACRRGPAPALADGAGGHGRPARAGGGLAADRTGRQGTASRRGQCVRILLRKSRARSDLGPAKNSSGELSSTIAPASMNTIRSAADRAKPISWVTTTIV